MEHSEVHFGSTTIAYTIERGRRQKTIAIAVNPDRSVRVRAPRDVPITRLNSIVWRKGSWIIDRRRRREDLPPPPTFREFVSGESFLYGGKQYRLKLVSNNKAERVSLVGKHLYLSTDRDPRRLLTEWYRKRAEERLESRVRIWAVRLGINPRSVLVRDQRTRWGSADSKGNLRFNWRIVQASTRIFDYVVAHELVHLIHRDHTRDFWAALGRVMPDYEARREALRVKGRAMVW